MGRSAELFDALEIVLDEIPTVLTIHGPGGVGKTRFSIELARVLHEEQAGGTFFVELAPLVDPASVMSLIAETVGVAEATGDIVAATAGTDRPEADAHRPRQCRASP